MIALVFEPMPTAGQASQRSYNMRSDTQRMIDGAMALAASFADGRKEKVAIKLREAADVTYDFGQSLDDLPHMRGYVEEAAHALAGLSDYVADVDIANMVDDLQSFARRRPALAFGAALLAGVAASRLIQSDGLRLRQQMAGEQADAPDEG